MPEHDTPRVFLDRDLFFHRERLSSILGEARYEVVKASEGDSLVETLREISPPPDLIILSFFPSLDTIGSLEAIRAIEALRDVPVLGVSPLDRSRLDLERLRGLGVVGLVDGRSLAEHVSFRVDQVVRHIDSGRRHERAPCCLPVDLDVAGEVTTEYALSLSRGGIGLTSTRTIEPNTEIGLRFWLPQCGSELADVRARVVYQRSGHGEFAPYRVGAFFLDLDEQLAAGIEREVRRLLDLAGMWSADADFPDFHYVRRV